MGLGGGGIMSTVVTGMALGAGSEVGHQAVRAMMGGGSSSHAQEAPQQQAQPQYYEQQQQQYAQPAAQQNPCQGFS